jgi:hypothetical protein
VEAGGLLGLNTIAGIAGCLAYGYASDKLFHARRPPVTLIFGLIEVGALFVIFFAPPGHPILLTVAFVLYGFGLNGLVTTLGGLFPTDLWGPDGIVGDVYHLDLPPWLPPGDYELHAGLYRRDIQQRLSLPDGQTTALVGKVQMGPPAKLDEGDAPGVPIALGLPATEGLVLFGQNPIPEQAHAGDSIDITLYWQIGEPEVVTSEVVFDLVPAGRSEPATSWQRRLAVHGQDRMTLEPGTVMAGWYPLELPADLLPGSYDLRVRVMEGGRSAEKPYRLVTLQLGLVE